MKFQKEKRAKVIESMKENSLALLTAGPQVKNSADENYIFSVNRNFYYLTGINEADVVLVLVKGNRNQEIIYVKKPNPTQEKWVGKTISVQEARDTALCSDIRYLDNLNKDLKEIIAENKIKNVYIDDEEDPIIHFGYDLLKECYPCNGLKVNNIYSIIAKLRTIKEKEEIDAMREAIHVTNEGLNYMLKNMKPNMRECEYEAYYNFVLTKNHVPVSIKTISSGGKNSKVLHYSENRDMVNDNEMILFDLGVNKDHWCSDISRTYPVNGKFTKRQRQIYDIVLRTQELVFKSIKPGVSLLDLQRITLDSYRKELKAIGLIQEGTDEEVKKYYWHSISHSLGLDTHDVGLERNEPLKAGMVITNEPGLYLEEEGIGVRIEDDILVTETGAENLSKEIMKDPDEIERFFKKR